MKPTILYAHNYLVHKCIFCHWNFGYEKI